MKRFLLSALSGLAIAGLASAATVTCPAPPNSGVPVDVVGLTVSCGGLTFSNFQVIPATGNPTPTVSLVSVDNTSGSVNLSFNPNMSAPTGAEDIHLYYSVSGAAGQWQGIDLTVGGQNATIIERVCDAPIPSTGPQQNTCAGGGGTQVGQLVAYSQPPGPNIQNASISSSASTLYVYKDIGVQANALTAGGGALTTFTQSWHAQVPEPASMLLLGAGFMALGLLRRRAHKS